MRLNAGTMYDFHATCFRGLEPALAAELAGLGAERASIDREIVFFRTSLRNAWLCNRRSRLANKIVLALDRRGLRGPEDLYRQSSQIAWEDLFSLDKTFKVETACILSRIDDSRMCNLRIKDAVADRFAARKGKRPDVSREEADVHIDCRIYKNESVLGLNLSGERLFKRGYRTETNAAPLKETLAAGIAGIALDSAPDARQIIDPMAGSGTLMIEAAMRLLGIPAGTFRKEYSFLHLLSYDPAQDPQPPPGPAKQNETGFVCCDHADAFLSNCRRNVANAGLSGRISVVKQDFFHPTVDMTSSLLLFNPPYGERLDGAPDIADFYSRIGDSLKKNCRNSTAWMFTEYGRNVKSVGLRSSRSIPLYNGKIECRLLEYRIF